MVERAYPYQYLERPQTHISYSLNYPTYEEYKKAILLGAGLVIVGVIIGALIVYLAIKK